MLQALDSVEKFADLIWAHHDGKCLRPAAGWDDVVDVASPLERDFVKEADGGHCHADRTGLQAACLWSNRVGRRGSRLGPIGPAICESDCANCEMY